MLTLDVRPHRREVLADGVHPQKLFVLVRLEPAVDSRLDSKEACVAVALAVDTSGSMYARLPGGTAKIDRAIESIDTIGTLPGIEHDTALAIVQFDTDATTLLPLTELGPGTAARISNEARRLRNFGGGTNLARALRLIERELAAARTDAIRKAVILTDGETTDEPECLTLAEVFSSAGIPLICVGFGTDYNEDFLATLADKTNGFLYHLSESEASMVRFQTALHDALVKSKRELVTDVRMTLELAPQASLISVTRVYPMVQAVPRADDGSWRLGNLSNDGEHVLVVECDLPPRDILRGPAVTVSVTYDVPHQGRTRVRLREDVEVTYTTDRSRTVELDQDVVFFVQQARISAYADRAVSLTRQGMPAEARKSVLALQELSSRLGNRQVSLAAEQAAMELASNDTLMPDTAKSIKIGAKTLTLLSPPTRQQFSPDTKQ